MPIGRWELYRMGYEEEVTFGTDPGGPYNTLWFNTQSLAPARELLRSERSLGNYRRSPSRMGMKSFAGDIVSELTNSIQDPFVESVLGGTFPTPWATVGPGTIGVTVISGQTATFSSTALFGSLAVGDVFDLTGHIAANNGRWVIYEYTDSSSFKAYKETTGAPSTDAGDGDEQLDQVVRLVDGIDERYFTLWGVHPDLSKYVQFLGTVINTMSLNLVPDQIVQATFGVMGRDHDPDGADPESGGAFVDPTTEYPFDVLTGVVAIDGTATTKITSARFDVTRNYEPTKAIGSILSEEIIPGKKEFTGNFTAYWDGPTQSQKFWDETRVSLSVQMTDPDSNVWTLDIWNMLLTSLDRAKNDDGAVMETFDWEATADTVVPNEVRGAVSITKE